MVIELKWKDWMGNLLVLAVVAALTGGGLWYISQRHDDRTQKEREAAIWKQKAEAEVMWVLSPVTYKAQDGKLYQIHEGFRGDMIKVWRLGPEVKPEPAKAEEVKPEQKEQAK